MLAAVLNWANRTISPSRWKWIPTSKDLLEFYQNRLLAHIKSPFRLQQIEFELESAPAEHKHTINTLSVSASGNDSDSRPHLLLIHGLGGGIGTWVMNIDELSSRYQVHAIDAPGFGASSRLSFHSHTPEEAEQQLVQSIEGWRQSMNIDRMTVVGHSFGGYMAGCYTLQHPNRVSQLVVLFSAPNNAPTFECLGTCRSMGHGEKDPRQFQASSMVGRSTCQLCALLASIGDHEVFD